MNPPGSRSRPRVYLAGPDVFRPDAEAHLQALAQECHALDMEALIPAECAVASGSGPERARHIYESNMVLLRHADGVIAKLQPFRGLEPASGTVFEVGVAVALGLPVVAYGLPDGTYADRAAAALATQRDGDGVLRDAGGAAVEDFGLSLNLMLSCSVTLEPCAEAALAKLASVLLRR
ncbi:nucleoside 2-deoxyribosyltransferase [Variovorax sp. M-6]|uniref:nucleoside 2-deoxyribosyltransferase n=1 Tax=Variovorax sp. M-6 TaxID=3233041 RepID=UPI003F95DBA5